MIISCYGFRSGELMGFYLLDSDYFVNVNT